MNALISNLGNWLDNRTGHRQLLSEALYENVPGGSRWIYVTGSMLVFAFVVQVITGIFLWMYYSPSSQNAWESVYYIQNELQGGWLLRGVHHYMAQAMIVLLPLHLLQVVLCKAYVAPREINYWLGLVLMLIVLGLGLTGYLLPWDQKGYWATKVATELMSLPPGGGYLQKLVVGGSEYGHLTLTRFFALHAGVLPGLLVLVLGLHIAMFRKHGITAHSSERRPDEYFWPAQVLKDSVACLVLLMIVVAVVCWRGAELGPPAEPTESYGAARPEWYFLFLFQLLKKCEVVGASEFVGAIVVPTLVMIFLFALPLVAKVRFGHVVNVMVILAIMMSAGYLTYEAIDHDNFAARHRNDEPSDPEKRLLWQERIVDSERFHEAQQQAHHEYERVQELVDFFGIPREGASVGLVRNDPEIQGPRIFRRTCASCHSYLDPDGAGIPGPEPPEDWDGRTPYGAPNLYGFASRAWIAGLLDPARIESTDYFGATAHGMRDEEGAFKSEGMVEFVHENLDPSEDDVKAMAITLSAEASLISQRDADAVAKSDGTLDAGREAMIDTYSCTDCHRFHQDDDPEMAPDLTGYGSAKWLYDFIANPARFYGDNNDRMPAFAQHPDEPARNLLSEHDMKMLVRWLRGDDHDLSLKLRAQVSAQSASTAEP